jgi:glycine/D-amino acid oxidase-like deaminating enzyme
MNCAIVGAGLAGLSLAFHLSRKGDTRVTLFDPVGAGGGASGVATGLLHPFPAKSARRSWKAAEAMASSLALISIAEAELGSPVAENSGVLRLAVTEEQEKDFRERAATDPAAIWRGSEEVVSLIPEVTGIFGGLWIPSGVAVYTAQYLQGLLLACQRQGVTLRRQEIQSLVELNHFDAVALAAGLQMTRFPECASLSLQITKGHTLLCRWGKKRLPCSLIAAGHITPDSNPELCHIGSTYEHKFSNLNPDPAAIDLLRAKITPFYPPAADFEVVEVRAACRVSPRGTYRPIAEQIGPRLWAFTGLGSRGLLYHALLGAALAEKIQFLTS